MSEVKVNKISPRSGTTVTLGDSGDTFTIPSGATINNQGTAVNFGATGSASWVTTVKTSSPFTAVAGEGYFVNTTGGAVTVNLPAGTAGAVVAIKDYAGTFDTNACTLVPNGSDKIGGLASNATLSVEGIAVTLVFIDSTQGWLVTDSGLQSEAPQPYLVDFLVIAGGGGSGTGGGGGGGAGGYRASFNSEASGGGGSSESSLNLSIGTTYTITVGSGGNGSTGASTTSGDDSSISGSDITTITSIGGGIGANGANYSGPGGFASTTGGSGGGAGMNNNVAGSAGTSNQGFAGGASPASGGVGAGGGGGAGAVGGDASNSPGDQAGDGGVGVASTITGSSVTRAGGGGGSSNIVGRQGAGGLGGGGDGSDETPLEGGAGSVNTGSGGGGGWYNPNTGSGGNGGSGVVILRLATANYSGTTTGSPTVDQSTVSGQTILTFNGSGSYTG